MSARVQAVAPATTSPVGTHPAGRATGGFRAALDGAVRALERADRPVSAPDATGVDAASALALQAEIYRQAERVELASKLLDHAVGAVKTVLQTRV